MNVGELIFNLGVKGSDKTVGALGDISKGLGDVKSMSLEAKAGILGAFYALQHFVRESNSFGESLKNFSAYIGGSSKPLQELQYAGQLIGSSAKETEGTLKTLQDTLTKIRTGGGAPQWFAHFAQVVGITRGEMKDLEAHPEKMWQKAQQYALKEKDTGVGNQALHSLGFNDNQISGLRRNAYNPDILKQAPVLSDPKINQLDKAYQAWEKVGIKIQFAINQFNALHGAQLAGNVLKITTAVLGLVAAFTKLAEKLHIFDGIAKIFEGWSKIFDLLNVGADKVMGATDDPKKRQALVLDTKEGATNLLKYIGHLGLELGNALVPASALPSSVTPQNIAPKVNAPHSTSKSNVNNVNINQTFQSQNPSEVQKTTAQSLKHAVRTAYSQSFAQGVIN